MSKFRPSTVVVLLMALLALGRAESSSPDVWMETRIAGQPAGYLHERTEPGRGGTLVELSESRLVINRLGSKVEIQGHVRREESPEGHLLGIRSELSSSSQSTVMEGSVREVSILLHISTGGKTYDRTIPFTGVLLGSEGVRQLTLARLKAPDDSVSYQVFSAELGVVSTVTRTCIAREKRGMKIEEAASGLPGQATLWLDDEGRTVRRVQSGPFGEIETVRTTEARARAATAGAVLPAEIYHHAVIRSNIRLPHERLIERLRIRVTHQKPELGWPDFASEYQTVIEKSANSVVLEIRRPTLAGHGQRPKTPDENLRAFLAPNALFQSDDRAVQRLAHEIVGENPDAFASALALRAWTSQNVRFDPGIAIAPASEVVRNRAGTCFGYSILLGSLARAAGIPSRMKMGFAYAGGIWGGHAWIEVLVDGQWIPIDAALTSPDITDAARFSFFTSALEEGTIADLGSLARMYGHVEVQILEYTVHGQTVTVPEHAERFTVEGNVYTNPWLGVKWVKPDEYRFTKLDSTWPDWTIVAMEGPQHESVELGQIAVSPAQTGETRALAYLLAKGITGPRRDRLVSDRAGFEIVSEDQAALVLPDSDETWIIVAKAPHAAAVLETTASKLELPRNRE